MSHEEHIAPPDMFEVPAYGLDGLDVCHFTEDGVKKLVVIAYATHRSIDAMTGILRPRFLPGVRLANDWYEFDCILYLPSDATIPDEGKVFHVQPPVTYFFDDIPPYIQGLKVHSQTVTSQVSEDDFHPEYKPRAKSISKFILGESRHNDFVEAYRDGIQKMGTIGGVGFSIPRVEAVVSTSPTNRSEKSVSQNVPGAKNFRLVLKPAPKKLKPKTRFFG